MKCFTIRVSSRYWSPVQFKVHKRYYINTKYKMSTLYEIPFTFQSWDIFFVGENFWELYFLTRVKTRGINVRGFNTIQNCIKLWDWSHLQFNPFFYFLFFWSWYVAQASFKRLNSWAQVILLPSLLGSQDYKPAPLCSGSLSLSFFLLKTGPLLMTDSFSSL